MLFGKLPLSTIRQAPSLIAKCGACGLYKGCRSPKLPVNGQGKKGIMVIGEAPGALEDERGRLFIGTAGQKIRAVLNKAGVDLDRDCWTTNSLICHPPEPATDKQIGYCQPNVIKAIQEHRPSTIILLGDSAVQSVVPYLWKDDNGGMHIGRWYGWQIPAQKINAWVCPTFHPSYVRRAEGMPNGVVVDKYFTDHVTAACALAGRPWKTVPNITEKIHIELSVSKIHQSLARFDGPIAFDFETNMLKPDHEDARIVSCAVSNGFETVAYPWTGEAIAATKELLESKLPKRGWNISFETRWAKRFGIKVRNWEWDGMVATHVLDNRRGICSFKFQSFVRLGLMDYDSHVETYLRAEHGYEKNRIDQLDLEELLLYNGIDAHGEFLVDQQQMKEMSK